jgi:NADH-quinone oxidoreductase subunit G
LYTHPQAHNIAKLAGLFQKHSNFKVIVIPPSTNALGVSLICDLDDHCDGPIVGYNAPGDFVLNALGASADNELDMPALNQQEGTFVSIDKRVVPLNAAVDYSGFELLDLVNEFGLDKEYAIELTSSLPLEKGFESRSFDSLPNYFDNAGVEQRGYLLSSSSVQPSGKIDELSDIGEFNGTVVYRCNPVLQFSPFTAKCSAISEQARLLASQSFMEKHTLQPNDVVELISEGKSIQLIVNSDLKISGDYALLPTFDRLGTSNTGYRFTPSTLKKVSL